MPAAPEPKEAGLFSELVRATRGLVLVGRTRPVAMFYAMAAVALVPTCTCCIGFAIVPLAAALSLGAARQTLTGEMSEKSDAGGAQLVVTLGYAFVPLVAFVALSAATPYFETPLPRTIVMGLAAAIAGALSGLVAGAPFHVFGGRGIADSVEHSLGDALRAGLGARAAAGATIAIVTTAVPAAFEILAVSPTAGMALWLVAIACSVAAQGIGMVWMLVLGVPVKREASTSPARGVVARLLWLGVPIAGIVVLAIGFASARPSPARYEPTAAERDRSELIVNSIALPGEHGLVVRVRRPGVVIETADGGGVGDVEFGPWMMPDGPDELRYARSEDGQWIVYARGLARRSMFRPPDALHVTRGVRFDAGGVRTDDGLVDRIRWRFGEVGLLLLLVSLLLATPFLVVLARGIGSAATLDRGEAGGDYTAWSGALELDAESEPRVVGGRLTAVDGARLVRDGSDGVVTLAPGALVLGPDGPLASGVRVSVVARKSRLATLGPRTGSVPWPKDAWLVVGSLDAAKDRIVRRSLRTAAVFGVPSALAALCACVASLLAS